MLAALGVVPTIAVLVAVTAGVALCTALLEQAGSTSREVTRRELTRREVDRHEVTRTRPTPARRAAPRVTEVAARVLPTSADRTAGAAPPTRPSRIVLVVDGPGEPVARADLGGPGADADLAGVLFAAYVDRGLPESSRVTGWVTASGSPASVPSVRAGDRLRGRARRICELLACGDDDRNWLTLDAATDVSLAIERRPPTDPTLAGLLHWWALATGDRSSLGPGEVRALAAGLADVITSAASNPAASTLEEVARVLEGAAASDRGVRLEVDSGRTTVGQPAAASGIGSEMAPVS